MPFVVVVVAPPLEEMVQLHQLHAGYTEPTLTVDQLRHICEQSDRLLTDSEWAKQADLVLVNRNRDISLRRSELEGLGIRTGTGDDSFWSEKGEIT